jgi:WD40 repeat protein/serine/threonine protein kinase
LLAAHDRADEVLGPAGDPAGGSVTIDPEAEHEGDQADSAQSPDPEDSSWQPSITAEHLSTARPDALIAGRFTPQQKLGEGGMGEVWVAKQTDPVKRKVALKLIKTGMDSRAVLARFEQERQALAMMDHPNIARVLDGGLTPGGQPFFVMELVNGLPLTKFCDEAKLTPKERLEIFVPICQAVQHAHQKGIVHRDLKPANILVTLIDGKPIPKVIDFGVAKATGGKLTDVSLSTQFGAVVGTLEYMSPEQAGLSGVDVDTRADIYSLGVILYELLTGLRPIDAGRMRRAALLEMIRIIQEEVPSKPSTRLSTDQSLASMAALRQTDPRKLMSLLRGELDWVVMKCLEKRRDRRYDTVSGLMRDVQRYLADEPVEARPPSAGYRLRKFLSRNKGPSIAAALVLVTLLVGIAGTTFGLFRAEYRRIEALTQKDIADKASKEAVAQKKIADTQKQLALENASKADENSRKAELRLAEGLISQADVWSAAGRHSEAHSLYLKAYDRFVELKAPLTASEVGLWSSYHQTSFPLLTFSERTGAVTSIAVAPDGRTAATGNWDNAVRLWDLATGKLALTLRGHSDVVTCVAFPPHGRTILSGSADRTLKLWDLATGKELRTFTAHSLAVQSVAIAPDGRTALSGSDDKTLAIWDLATGRHVRALTGHSSSIKSVAFAPDCRSAISSDLSAILRIWDVATGKELRTLTCHSADVHGVAISSDGRSAISGNWHGELTVWELASGKELRTVNVHFGVVDSVAVSTDGRTAISDDAGKVMTLFDLESGKELRKFTSHSRGRYRTAIDPNGRFAVSISGDTSLNLWKVAGDQDPRGITGNTGAVTSIAIAPDGRTMASGSSDKTLRLWDLSTGKELRTFGGHSAGVTCVAFSPHGRTALTGSADCKLKFWELGTGKELRTFTGHSRSVESVAITPDGRTALSGSFDKTLKIWDLATGKELRALTGHSRSVQSIAIAPDGRTALSTDSSEIIRQWDLSTGKELRTFISRYGAECVAISPNGLIAISGGASGLTLWDLASGSALRTITTHAISHSVAISPEGSTAFSEGAAKALTLWDLTSGNELRILAGHSDGVRRVAIGSNGYIAISGNEDKTFKLWDLNRGVAHRAFEPPVAAAQARLHQVAGDASALATLGEWYAFRGMDDWAVELLAGARERGAGVSPLTLARCYWKLNRNGDARREFQVALEESKDPGEQTYLACCIQAIDTEPDRKRQEEALAATAQLELRAEHAGELTLEGKLVEAVAEVAELTKNSNWNAGQWYNFACVYSLASDKIVEKKTAYAVRAMELFHKAVREGWNDVAHTAKDADLDPLRDREDFKKLLADLNKKAAASPEH